MQVEDLSDAAFIQLHQPYEDQERSRWTWMALAPAKRRGSRWKRTGSSVRVFRGRGEFLKPAFVSLRSYKSVDGRTTPLLCGTNPPTPQPASPDPGPYPLLHDYSHVPSPMSPPSPDTSSNPQTPCSRDSHRLLSNEDTRCSTPDFTFEERVCGSIDRRLRLSDSSGTKSGFKSLNKQLSSCFYTTMSWTSWTVSQRSSDRGDPVRAKFWNLLHSDGLDESWESLEEQKQTDFCFKLGHHRNISCCPTQFPSKSSSNLRF